MKLFEMSNIIITESDVNDEPKYIVISSNDYKEEDFIRAAKLKKYKYYPDGGVDSFRYDGNFSRYLKNLLGSPKYTKQSYQIVDANSLNSLEGSPEKVGTSYELEGCGIKNLINITPYIEKTLFVTQCHNIENFKGIKYCGAGIEITLCKNIKTIKHLWDMKFNKTASNPIRSESVSPELSNALGIMSEHLKNGTKNYLEVMRDAKSEGVEDYFK